MAETDFPLDVPVFVVVEVLTMRDPDVMADYVAAIAPQMDSYGAVNVGAGLKTHKGTSDAIHMVISRWPSAQAYLDWQASDDYAPWGEKRKAAADIRAHFIPVLPGA
ncbi:MAG: DUF1330 domain-containing protein [Arenibacterium sp.]